MGIGPFQSGSLKAEIARTTTGKAAVVRDRVPPMVVFDGRPKPLEQNLNAIEITSEQQASGTAEGSASVRPSPYYDGPKKGQ